MYLDRDPVYFLNLIKIVTLFMVSELLIAECYSNLFINIQIHSVIDIEHSSIPNNAIPMHKILYI